MQFTPVDPEFESRVRESFAGQAMMTTIGAEIVVIEPGLLVAEFEHSEHLTQQDGFVHAGAITTALDSACGYAAFTLMPADGAVLTTEFKVNLLRPGQAARYRVSATVVKPGRTLTVCQAVARPATGDPRIAVGGDEIAMMTATLICVADPRRA